MINRNNETLQVLRLYEQDEEVRNFIDEIYLKGFLKYHGKLRLAIRDNLEVIQEFILERDNKEGEQ